jgi:hypothetical protein
MRFEEGTHLACRKPDHVLRARWCRFCTHIHVHVLASWQLTPISHSNNYDLDYVRIDLPDSSSGIFSSEQLGSDSGVRVKSLMRGIDTLLYMVCVNVCVCE